MGLKIFYKISEHVARGTLKVTKQQCIENFLKHFPTKHNHITFIVEKFTNISTSWLKTLVNEENIIMNKKMSTTDLIKLAIENCEENDYVYIVEDNYIHKTNSNLILLEGLFRFDYITLYDHPDKYVNDGTEETNIYLTKNCHWKLTNSTTMTFAAHVDTLKNDLDIFMKYEGNEFKIFEELTQNKSKKLACSIPGYCTKMVRNGLSPLTDWQKEI
jgi:ribosomal protein S17E